MSTVRMTLRLASATSLTLLLGYSGLSAQPSTIDPNDALMARQVRALELRAPSDPGSAARDATQLRREFLNRSSGAPPSSDAMRLDRRLQQIERVGTQAPPTLPDTTGPRAPSPLPSSYGPGPDPTRSFEQSPFNLVDGLLVRAEDSVNEGRMSSARSDLSLARQQLTIASTGSSDTQAIAARERRLTQLIARAGQP